MRKNRVLDEIVEDVVNETDGRYEPLPITDMARKLMEEAKPYAFYHSDSNNYYTEDAEGDWDKTSEGSLKRLMRQVVYRQVTLKEGLLDKIDDHIIAIQKHFNVALACPVAGLAKGLHKINGNKILVTKGANYIRPRAGEWPTLQRFITELFGDQLDFFLAWTQSGLWTLKEGHPFRPGQALAIAGGTGCGKSLLQSVLTDLFGGRKAEPYKVMIGNRDHNSQLFKAEHLMIEDQAAETDIKSRRRFAAAIKNTLVNETQEFHKKNGEPVILSPFWRLTITLNDEPESMLVLPPIDEHIKDKIILLKASKATFPYKEDDLKARRAFRQRLVDELPAFVSWLNKWRMPLALRSQRYGCIAWQHPELLEALTALSPQTTLLELIDHLQPWKEDRDPFVGTAAKLKALLLEKDKTGEVNRLLYYPSSCGAYLARLAKEHADRVQEVKKVNNKSIWRVCPPPAESAETVPF